MKHFIAMNGTHGCMPDSTSLASNIEDAVQYLDMLLELTDEQKDDLLNGFSVSCTPKQGTQYCEVADCNCPAPWEHSDEHVTEAEFKRENPEYFEADEYEECE